MAAAELDDGSHCDGCVVSVNSGVRYRPAAEQLESSVERKQQCW
jgi:hypothetical protein